MGLRMDNGTSLSFLRGGILTSIYPDKQMHAYTICAVSITHSVTQSLPVEGEGVTILTLCAFLEHWCLLHYTTVDHQYVNIAKVMC